ncbi:hypothetical protein P7C73_g6445, partial [Tremellales sp. Uapishka_1]
GSGGGRGAAGGDRFERGGYRPSPPREFAPLHGNGNDEPLPGGRIDFNMLPPGVDVLPGQKATDAISKTLAAISPGQMQDVMAGMKTLVTTQPDQARQLLAAKPQLAYALFQAMLLMNIVDPAVLQRIKPIPNAAPPAPPPQAYPPAQSYPPYQAPAPTAYPPYPPAPTPATAPYRPPATTSSYAPPPPTMPPQNYSGGGYAAPPPLVQNGMAQAQAALATSGLPEEQKAMLLQVLQLTPDQINALDPAQKASIMALRQQFLGAAA